MAFNPKPRPLCNLMHIVEMLNKAKSKLQSPTVRVAHEGKYFVLSCAAANSANPGYIYIKLNGEQGTYLGKIAPNGDFFVGYSLSMHKDTWLPQLEHINSDPVAACIAYGKESGYCSYCGRELTHPRSVHYGYGPICAANYGLPYEEISAEIAAPLLVQSTFDHLDRMLAADEEEHAAQSMTSIEQYDRDIADHDHNAVRSWPQGSPAVSWTAQECASAVMEKIQDTIAPNYYLTHCEQGVITHAIIELLTTHRIRS